MRKRRLSLEPVFQVGDIVERVDDQILDRDNDSEKQPAFGVGSWGWYVLLPRQQHMSVGMRCTRIMLGQERWAHPETIPLDQLELLDIRPYPSPPSGAVTTPEERDISISRNMVGISLQEPSILRTPGAEIQWVPSNRLGRAWEVADIVRRYIRPAEPGAKGVILGQMGVICGGDRGSTPDKLVLQGWAAPRLLAKPSRSCTS